ncbi:hypothetical protein HWI79_2111 [Cryptosporidium felis]|nr:hypothetical protein HWI79_2111 [Cryptosporidium felis]
MNDSETKKDLKNDNSLKTSIEDSNTINIDGLKKLPISRSAIILISVLSGFSLIVVVFHAIPRILENTGLLFGTWGNPMRFDHRLSSILLPPLESERGSLRGHSGSPYNAISVDTIRRRSLSEIQDDEIFEGASEPKRIGNSSQAWLLADDSTFSNSSFPRSPVFNSTDFSVKDTGPTPVLANYTCHKLILSKNGNGDGEFQDLQSEDNCKVHTVTYEPYTNKTGYFDIATANALNSLNGTLELVLKVVEILDKKPAEEGLLVVMVSEMQYEPNWESSLARLRANWNFQTQVSQIILTSWIISKSFLVGRHNVPALDFGFLIISIPPEIPEIDGSVESLQNLRQSIKDVKLFVSKLRSIIEEGIFKLRRGPSLDTLRDNKFTFDLFDRWNFTDESYSSLSNYFNKNQTMLVESYLSSVALDLSRVVEEMPFTIVDSTNLAKDNLEYKYKKDANFLHSTDPKKTQVVIIPTVERKKIAKHGFEIKFRRICVYQAHTEQKSILRSTPSRASMAEYARYHGYSYFLFDGSFYDSIPRVMFTDWSKQGFYIKLFSGLRLLFWNLDKIGELFGVNMGNPYADILSEKKYVRFLEDVVPGEVNLDWDREHDGKLRKFGRWQAGNVSGREGVQITPSNLRVDVCDYIVWFDLDIAITNKYYSIERMLENNSPGTYTESKDMVKSVHKDIGDLSLLVARDSAWTERNSLVNSGFLLIARNRYSLQSLFHSIALDPVMSQEVVENGRFWPEQSTLTHAVLKIFNYTFGTPNETVRSFKDTLDTVNYIKNNFSGPAPVILTAYNNESNKYFHSVVTSQRVANGFLHISPNKYGEGPWYPGDLFIHAAGQKSPFRDNVLSGMVFSINSAGFSSDEIGHFKDSCYVSLEFVYQGLDKLIGHLSNEFEEFNEARARDYNDQLSGMDNVDLTFNFIKRLMAVKTRGYVGEFGQDLLSTDFEKIHFMRCDYFLPMSAKWSIAEAFAFGAASVLGIGAIITLFKLSKRYNEM